MAKQTSKPPRPAPAALERLRARGEAAASQVAQAPVHRLHGEQSSTPKPQATTKTVKADTAGSSATAKKSSSGNAVVAPTPGPRGRLGANGEKIVKLTMELPVLLVDRLAAWEERETERSGKRVHRERLIDLALDTIPREVSAIASLVASMPESYLESDLEPIGTRVRASVQVKLLTVRPRLKAQRMQHIYQWQIYAAAIESYLTALEEVKQRTLASEGGAAVGM